MARFRGFRKLLILASALAVFGLIAELAVADELTDQERFIQLINQERAAHGLPSLGMDGSLVNVARAHSARMSSAGTIFHNSNLANEVAGGWAMLGENVGVGESVEALHQAFMNSESHRANVLGPFDQAGIGVVMSGSTIYVTEVFWKTAPPPAPAPVASVASGGKKLICRKYRGRTRCYWVKKSKKVKKSKRRSIRRRRR